MLAEKTHLGPAVNSNATNHTLSRFWQNWLYLWCAGVALFGLALAGAAFEISSGPARTVFQLLNQELVSFTPHMRFSVALLGAISIGWSLTLVAAIAAAIRLGQSGRPIWILLMISTCAWFVIDSSLSIATGFALNTVPNTALIVGFLIPILRGGVLR